MTTATIVVRGAAVFFSVVFRDADKNPVNPATAQLRIAYAVAKAATVAELPLVSDGDVTWNATWDSGPADSGMVAWWAQSGDPPKSATQGTLKLEANLANPQS